jgi:ketosteroid isomerase-like protein
MKTLKPFAIIVCSLFHALCFTSCNSPTGSGLTEADKQYILDVTTSVQDNWNEGKREPYLNRFSKEAVYMAPNMEALIGKDAIRDFANAFPDLKLKFSVLEIMGSAEYAYLRGGYVLTTRADSLIDKGKFLSIWKKNPENIWLLTHDMFSSDLPFVK